MRDPSSEMWTGVLRDLETPTSVAAARSNAVLLRKVQDTWSPRVDVRSSMHNLLFTTLGDSYPFRTQVRVAWTDGVYEMQLIRDSLTVTGDKCADTTSASVLSALLAQLASGET